MVAGELLNKALCGEATPLPLSTICDRNSTLFIYLHLKHATPFTCLIRTMRHFSKPLE